jgi:type I restriction enzyme, S subunit
MSNAVPEGWAIQPLNGKVEILSGYPFKSSLFCDEPSKIGVIRIRDLAKQSVETFYAGDFDDEYVVRSGDILIGMDGDFNIVKWKTKNALLNQRICKIKASKGSGVDSDFLFYSLVDDLDAIHAATGATTVKHLSVKDIKGIEKAYPPLPEQQKIAAILSSVDDVIEKTRAQIDKLKDLKTGMMQELLTKGIGHTEFKDSPVGRIPLIWDAVPISYVMKSMANGVVGSASSHYRKTGIPYLMSKNVRANRLDLRGLTFISDVFNRKSSRSILEAGDLLTVQSGHIGTSAVVPKEFHGANCHALIVSKPLKNKINTHFLAYYLNSLDGRERLSLLFVGSTVPHINTSDLKKFLVPLPPISEQENISDILFSVDHKIDLITERLNQYHSIKKALMQDLLTGKVRVRIDENEKEPAVA